MFRRRWFVCALVLVALTTSACGREVATYSLTAEDCGDVTSAVDRGRSTVTGYEISTNAELWHFDAGYGPVSPLAHAGVVFVVRTAPAGDSAEVIGLDPSTGAERWAQSIDEPAMGSLLPYGADSVAVSLSNWNGPYAVFDVDGRRSEQPFTLVTGSTLPLPNDSNRLGRLVVSRNQIKLVDPESGTTAWQATVPPLAGPETDIDVDVVPADDVLVVRSHGVPTGISGIDRRAGTVLWTHSDSGLVELVGIERTEAVSVVVRGSAGTHGLDPGSGRVLWTASDANEADRRVAGADTVPDRYLEDRVRWDPPPGAGRVAGGGVDFDDQGHAFVLRFPDGGDDEFGARALADLCDGAVRSTPSSLGIPR